MNRCIWNESRGDERSRETLELSGAQYVRLIDAHGIAVSVRAGTVWMTQQDNRDDIFIGAGETLVVNRPGLVLVTPIDEATVVISARPSQARSCRIERVNGDGQRYPVLCARPELPLMGRRPAPALAG